MKPVTTSSHYNKICNCDLLSIFYTLLIPEYVTHQTCTTNKAYHNVWVFLILLLRLLEEKSIAQIRQYSLLLKPDQLQSLQKSNSTKFFIYRKFQIMNKLKKILTTISMAEIFQAIRLYINLYFHHIIK